MGTTFDDRDFQAKAKALLEKVAGLQARATQAVGYEVLRLSSREVPHNIGTLQNSGHIHPNGDETIVGYNTVYAARLHEHPEYHFQKGRKGKYLEDPIKNNIDVLREVMGNIFK